MNTHSLKDEVLRIKDALLQQGQVMGIILYRETAQGTSGDDLDSTLVVLVPGTELVGTTSAFLKYLPEQPTFQISIHTLAELNESENPTLQKMFREGKLIYWNSIEDLQANQVFKIKLHSIFTFELTRLPQTTKAKFNYQLYGRKGNGLLDKLEGKRLTKSCFYLPYKNKFKIIRFFTSFEISYKAMEIWL
jgi:hypothetical protein